MSSTTIHYVAFYPSDWLAGTQWNFSMTYLAVRTELLREILNLNTEAETLLSDLGEP